MKVEILHGEKVISSNIMIADNFWSRFIGLMFREKPSCDGILLEPGQSIHTFFMRYSLDVVFLGSRNQVIKIIRDMKPWRMTWIYLRSNRTLELPAGKLPSDLKEGDVLEVRHV